MRSATGAIKIVDDKAQAALGQLAATLKAIDGLEVRSRRCLGRCCVVVLDGVGNVVCLTARELIFPFKMK